MSASSLPGGSVILRLEFSIADAVQQRGLLSVIAAALRAWWNQPRLPVSLPAHLRADIGLPPLPEPVHWLDISPNAGISDALRRPGM